MLTHAAVATEVAAVQQVRGRWHHRFPLTRASDLLQITGRHHTFHHPCHPFCHLRCQTLVSPPHSPSTWLAMRGASWPTSRPTNLLVTLVRFPTQPSTLLAAIYPHFSAWSATRGTSWPTTRRAAISRSSPSRTSSTGERGLNGSRACFMRYALTDGGGYRTPVIERAAYHAGA